MYIYIYIAKNKKKPTLDMTYLILNICTVDIYSKIVYGAKNTIHIKYKHIPNGIRHIMWYFCMRNFLNVQKV